VESDRWPEPPKVPRSRPPWGFQPRKPCLPNRGTFYFQLGQPHALPRPLPHAPARPPPRPSLRAAVLTLPRVRLSQVHVPGWSVGAAMAHGVRVERGASGTHEFCCVRRAMLCVSSTYVPSQKVYRVPRAPVPSARACARWCEECVTPLHSLSALFSRNTANPARVYYEGAYYEVHSNTMNVGVHYEPSYSSFIVLLCAYPSDPVNFTAPSFRCTVAALLH
jgi:hypothetical protein